jgi:hypothetical protein
MLESAANTFLATASDPNSESIEINASAQAFLKATTESTPAEKQRAIQILSAGFSLDDLMRSGFLAMVCGVLLERGAMPGIASASFISWLEDVLNRQAAGDDWAESAFDQFWPAAIAFFSKDPEARRAAWRLRDALTPRVETQDGAFWVHKMLAVLHDESILVIEPATKLGFVGRMSGVADNFQLHTLLMGVFPHKNPQFIPRVSEPALQVARGTGPHQAEESVKGHWNLCTWRSVLPSLELMQDASQHWIWGEGIPMDIPVFEGHRVVLLGPASYQRSWGSSRQFGHLLADIRITQRLAPKEIESWLHTMAVGVQANPGEGQNQRPEA